MEGDRGAAVREQARRRVCHGFSRAAAAAIVQRRNEATGKETKAAAVMEGGGAFTFLLRQSLMMMGGDRGYRSLAVTAGSAAAGNPWCGGDSGSVRDRGGRRLLPPLSSPPWLLAPVMTVMMIQRYAGDCKGV